MREELAANGATLETERTHFHEKHATALVEHQREIAAITEQHRADLSRADETRQAAKANVEQAERVFKLLEVERDEYRKASNDARDNAARWQGRAEILQSNAEGQQTTIDALSTQSSTAESHHRDAMAALQTALTALRMTKV